MWFTHMIGAGLHIFRVAGTSASCWNRMILLYEPPYTYMTARLKEPPDGVITGCLILFVMIITNVFLLIHGLYQIHRFVQVRKSQATSNCPSLLQRLRHGFKSICSFQFWSTREWFQCLHSVTLGFRHVVNESSGHRQSCFTVSDTIRHAFSLVTKAVHVTFDTDSKTIVLDNSATCHICNDKDLFVDAIEPLTAQSSAGVETAGGTASPEGMGCIKIHFHDNEGKLHSKIIKDVLYFPKSPVNILGVTLLGEQWEDPEGVCISTKSKYSVFTWDGGKSIRNVTHKSSGLPELPINEGASMFSAFFASYYSIFPPPMTTRECMLSSTERFEDKSLHSNSGATSCYKSSFRVGEKVALINPGSTEGAVVCDAEFDTNMQQHVKVKLSDGNIKSTSAERLRRVSEADIGVIPRTPDHVVQDADRMSKDALAQFLCPAVLSKDEEEFMQWHHRLNHMSTKNMLRLAKAGKLPKKFLKLDKIPKCASCAFGQAHRKQWKVKGQLGNTIRSKNETRPGDGVSVDQIVSAQPGLVAQTAGFLTSDRIAGATVFVDHVTQFTYVHLMKDLTTELTLEAKSACDRVFAQFGHKIRHYRADNGRFADQEFIQAVHSSNQRISFCGVGAHHQNAIAERGIKELTLIGRTLLLHAQRHWPEYITTMLWPIALKAASDRMNTLSINDSLESPLSRISGAAQDIDVSTFHTWGCPVYVLEAGLQSGSIGPPKWDPRARLGIYVGRSPFHAGNVALVLNPRTGLVSPQYHVTFDDHFSTIPHLRSGTTPPDWVNLVRTSSEKVTDEAYRLSDVWFNDAPSDSDASTVSDDNTCERGSTPNTSNCSSERGSSVQDATDESTSTNRNMGTSHMPPILDLSTSGYRRSTRNKRPPNRFGFFAKFCLITAAALTIHKCNHPSSFVSRIMTQMEKVNLNFDGTSNYSHPFAFASSLADNESYTLKEMLKQPDVPSFVQAMTEEVAAHEANDHWELVPRSSIGNVKTILAIWSFKRKRFPDGSLNKHKARLCAHGGMQKWGVNYWETYAPVVNWISVRTLLAISVMNDLPTTAIDFVLAFPQATLSEDEKIYMELPYGFEFQDKSTHVLRLKKNLYGLKQAGLNWFEYIKEGLSERGFTQSQIDPCVFYRKDAIIVMYVDDCLVMSENLRVVDDIVKSLQTGINPANPNVRYKTKYSLTNDGSIKNYLGVEVIKNEQNGTLELKQKFLIERILKAIDLDKEITNASKPTPVMKPLLHKDLEGLQRKYDWNYRSLVGMLGYLQNSTRPDISMATHQCARFNNDPKLSHERSIRRICKYLLGTQDRGLVFKPDISKGIECFVDADFSGNWNAIDSEDPENVLSRTGYIIYYGRCPIHWVSKLQTEIALSTTESEYIALAQSMRDVIPLMNLLEEFGKVVKVTNVSPEIKCKVFEDNTSCIKVATAPSMTPRTKHIALKYHFFRSHVKSGKVTILPISTTEQRADILTKPLSGELFVYLRNKIMGWEVRS